MPGIDRIPRILRLPDGRANTYGVIADSEFETIGTQLV
jgi:hypothetical protein